MDCFALRAPAILPYSLHMKREIMERTTKKNWKETGNYFINFLKWTAAGLIVGAIVGLVGVGFAYSMKIIAELRTAFPWLLFGLPIAGILIVALYHMADASDNKGTNLVLLSVRTEEEIPFRVAPLILIATLLTHLCGGSSGREGAALQIGGSVAQQIGRTFHADKRTMKLLSMCGMSACFAALFGTPAAATVFSMEVVSVGIMHYSALIPCAVSALTADFIARSLEVEHMQFSVPELTASFTLDTGARVILLAICCAVVGACFCILLHTTGKYYKKFFPNPYIRAAAGGILIIALTLLLGTRDYLSVGENILHTAVTEGTARPEAFLLKMLFTALTLEAGFKGGEIVPSLFIGATLGCVLSGLLGLNASFCAALGMTALFCSVTNCPLSSILLGLELFGGNGIEWFLLTIAICYMLSGYYSLYSSQKIMYSKEMPVFIDRVLH